MPLVDTSAASQHDLAFLVEYDIDGEIALLIGEDDIDDLAVLDLPQKNGL